MSKEEKGDKTESEFSMGELDFQRFNTLLEILDDCAVRVRKEKQTRNSIKLYFSVLKQLYINFRQILVKALQIKMDLRFNMIEKQIWNYNTINRDASLVSKLQRLPQDGTTL